MTKKKRLRGRGTTTLGGDASLTAHASASSPAQQPPASSPAPPQPPASSPAPPQPPPSSPDPPGSPQPPASTRSSSSRRYWTVNVIDEQGLVKQENLRVKDVWLLARGRRVMLEFNESLQPIGEVAGLLGGILGELAADFVAFPINYESWHKVPNAYKEQIYKSRIMEKFNVDEGPVKQFILKNIGKKWKDNRGKLYHEWYEPSIGREANITKHPPGISHDQWASFIDYRARDTTKEICQKNIENRSKLTIPHTGGSKSLARRKHEMEVESGQHVSRGALYIATHKKRDGSFVNEEARTISNKISEIESQGTSSQSVSLDDSLAQVLGKEHPGRVRGLGFGPSPSQVFGTSSRLSGISLSANNAGPSAAQYEQTVKDLKDELHSNKQLVQTLQSQMQSFQGAMTYIFTNMMGNVPPEFAAVLNALVPDANSGQASPAPRPSSNASHDIGETQPSPPQ